MYANQSASYQPSSKRSLQSKSNSSKSGRLQSDRSRNRPERLALYAFVSWSCLLGSALPAAAQSTLPTEVVESTELGAPRTTQQTAYSVGAQRPQAQANSRIVLNLEARRVYLYQSGMLVSSYPVAIGAAETPTPTGEFEISKMVVDPVWQNPWTGEITPPGPDSALGLRWLEFTTSEEGAYGFHGTPTIESIGQAASNGCVRMRNEDVVALFSKVSVGTTVIVQ